MALNGLIQNSQLAVIRQQFFDALPAELASDYKCHGCAQQIANQHKKKTPPEPKEKTAAHAQNASRQKQQVAQRVGHRIDDSAPDTQLFNIFADIPNPIHDRILCRGDEKSDDAANEPAYLDD
jgi:hypothetical protein